MIIRKMCAAIRAYEVILLHFRDFVKKILRLRDL